mgnify:FL=1
MADTRIKLKADFSQIQNSTRALITSITNLTRVFQTVPKPILNAQQTLAKMAFTAKQNRGLFLQLGKVVKDATITYTKFGQTVSNTNKVQVAMTSRIRAGAVAFGQIGQAAVAAGASINYYATSAARAAVAPLPQGPPTAGGVAPKATPAVGAGAGKSIKGVGNAMKGASSSARVFAGSLQGVTVTLKTLTYSFAPLMAILGAAALL